MFTIEGGSFGYFSADDCSPGMSRNPATGDCECPPGSDFDANAARANIPGVSLCKPRPGATTTVVNLTPTPFYKKPLFWAAVAGGVVVVGGGAWAISRRRKAT
jgi:hypothetical protein